MMMMLGGAGVVLKLRLRGLPDARRQISRQQPDSDSPAASARTGKRSPRTAPRRDARLVVSLPGVWSSTTRPCATRHG
eukprot:scaffold7589_cov106-Isochrysis_galbana.AAC.3